MLSNVVYFIILCDFSLQQSYVIPEARVKLLYPIGFSVSIPDDTGIRLFAFHGKLNEEFQSKQDGGFYSRDVTSPKNYKWTFTDKSTRFKIGDTIHYWLFVDYFNGRNKLGYTSEYRKYTITECPRNIVDEQGFCNAPLPGKFEIPDAIIEVLQPKGFKVSIPDQPGIALFAFHGNINKEINGRESGYFSGDITAATEGRWTFVDTTTSVKPGDIIYYWIYVVHKNEKGAVIGRLKENLKYIVTDSQGTSQKPCVKSDSTWNGKSTCVGQLLFNDEFKFLNTNDWRREIRYADDPDYEFVIYDKFDDNLYIKDGVLHIKSTLADDRFGEGFIYLPKGYDLGSSCTSDVAYNCKRTPAGGYALPPILSARINSIHSFKYGRVDIKAKLPKGDWIYPQLLLTSRQNDYGSQNYDSGEIRIAFVNGNTNVNSELQGMILLGTSTTARQFGIQRVTNSNEGWSDNYHIFSVLWESDSLTFLVDNKKYGTITPPTDGFSSVFMDEKPETAAKWKLGSRIAPFDKEMFITIGVGVGGHSFPDTLYKKPYTNLEAKPQLKFYKAKNFWKPTWNDESELTVDYIKVYAL